MATNIGTVIEGKYEILKLIGTGGMSYVYLAMDKRLNKQWAVKEIKKTATAVKDANVLYLYPCQWVEKACEVEFTRNAAAYTDITITAEFIDQKIGFKEDEIGLTKDTAYEIPLSGHPYSLYEGLTGTGTDERWYKFNVADKAVIDPSFHLVNTERATYFGQNRTFIRVYDSNNNQIYSEGSSNTMAKRRGSLEQRY